MSSKFTKLTPIILYGESGKKWSHNDLLTPLREMGVAYRKRLLRDESLIKNN